MVEHFFIFRCMDLSLCARLHQYSYKREQDVLRSCCSILGCIEPEVGSASPDKAKETSERLMGVFVSSMCYWYHFTKSGRRVCSPITIGSHTVLQKLRNRWHLRVSFLMFWLSLFCLSNLPKYIPRKENQGERRPCGQRSNGVPQNAL